MEEIAAKALTYFISMSLAAFLFAWIGCLLVGSVIPEFGYWDWYKISLFVLWITAGSTALANSED